MLALILVVAGTAVLGYFVTLLPGQGSLQLSKARLESMQTPSQLTEVAMYPAPLAGEDVSDMQARIYLAEILKLIEEGKVDTAFEYLNRVRVVVEHRAEALRLMGEILLQRGDNEAALDFFYAAIDRDPLIDDAYFGYAIASENLGELEQAIGGMRSYLHLQSSAESYHLKVAQARSAIWEWEARLGRGAWGPTTGVPPGFTPEELLRDGKGTGTKVPIPGTEDERGYSRYEIKHSDKLQLFEP
jgi:tetratricopeptide (TPR) repeat protein